MDEKMLIKRATGGDKDAFASLYMRYKDDLYRYAYFKLGNADDACDAVSSCVISAFTSIYSLRVYAAFKAWIFRILYRSCCQLIAEQRERLNRVDVSALDRLPAEPDHLSPELKEAFGILSSDDRDIVLLSTVAGYNSSEIAVIMGLKPSTVRSRLKRALAKMKQFLE